MSANQQIHSAVLTAENPNSQRFVAQLDAGKSVIVGSGKSCGLFLDDPQIATMHCSFRLCDRELWVQDWCSESGTFVNGERISDETVVPEGAVVCLGGFMIRAQTTGAQTTGALEDEHGSSPAPALPATTNHADPHECVDPGTAVPSAEQRPAETQSGDCLSQEPATPSSEPSDLPDSWSSWDESEKPDSLLDDGDSFANDTIELLRSEVEHLQSELVERDARLAELENGVVYQETPSETTADDVSKISDRLEQLLEELAQSDLRIEELEDLLRLSDEANRAEQEERHQLEEWVADIERRIGQREDEWRAENEHLKKRIEQLKTERNHAEQRLQHAASSSGPNDSRAEYEGVLATLRTQNDELQKSIEEADAERTTLQEQIQLLEQSQSESAQRAQLDETLREERANVAKERAELARMRAELSNKISDAERQLDSKENSEVDNRLHELREHLKEIHAEEKTERVDRSLSNRIARLWKRLDG